jgi:trans-4-hydroxy-L-proline dehydratase
MQAPATTPARSADTLTIPGISQPISLRLPPDIARLREAALDFHTAIGTNMPPIPELTLSDAAAWAQHGPDEDWQTWRARMVAARLRTMPLDLEQGERIVGRPRFRQPEADEVPSLDAARQVLATMPPFPGGDAGHLHPDYEKLLRVGVRGIREEIAGWQARTEGDGEKQAFYAACSIALDGLAAYIDHVAAACESRAAAESAAASVDMGVSLPAFRGGCSPRLGNHGAPHAQVWLELADLCRHVAAEPPRTFHEAIQLLFLALVGLWQGEGHYLTSPGRLDRTLRPFYEADLAEGRITPQEALELICTLYIQCNRIMSTGLALAVMVGGRDAEGRDMTNDLTYLCIAARIITGLGYPTVGLSWHRAAPSELVDFAVEMLGRGRGDPAFFNEELIVGGLADHGVPMPDAVNYMNSTCVEIKPVGASNIWVTQPYFNLPLGLLQVMEEARRGDQPEPATFEELEERVRGTLAAKIAAAAADLDRIWQERASAGCFPLASCLTDDCLSRGLDFDRGGARYNWVENSMVGLANLADSLVVVRHLVYETRELALAQFAAILAADFAGHEPLRQRILNRLPKYGNDDDGPDEIAGRWAEWLMAISEAQSVGPHRYVPGFFCWIMHERMGSETSATPDGRRAGWPMADGAGAAQGRERRGPTASVLSTTAWSHRPALGGLVHNAKFSANLLKSDADRDALRRLIETYLQRGGFEMQVNVVSRDTLLAAREHPEQHRDLLVRVAGYSDYFVKLTPAMQEEVIERTEHEL